MNARTAELILGPMRSIRRAAILWTIFIAAMVFITVAVWPAFKGSSGITQAMDQLPQGVIQAFGLEGFGTPAGFLRGNLYDFFIPLLMAGAAVGFANSLTSSEEDAGRLELTLAQPVTRQAIFLGRTLAVFGCVVAITIITALVQFGSDALFGLQIATDRLLSTLVLCGLLALFVAALTLAIAGLVGRPSLVLGAGLFVAVGGAIVAALFPLSSALAELAHVSPWDWAFGGDPLINPTDLWRYLVLAVPAGLLIVAAVWAFCRRDISAA
jgi:ABC-2 type transport system permease protein